MQNSHRLNLAGKKRIVIKVGSTTLTHPETGAINLGKIEQLARQISDLKGKRQMSIMDGKRVGRRAAGRRDIKEERCCCRKRWTNWKRWELRRS